MSSHKRFLALALSSAIFGVVPFAAAQPARTGGSSSSEDAQLLAKGWTAVAAGRPAEAEKVGDALLKASPRDHDAVALKIAARLAARGATAAVAALDAYEGWLQAVREREDVFLLESIASGALGALATSTDATVRARALELLAASGSQNAAAQLRTIATAEGGKQGVSDAALARLGDASAVQRLAVRVKSGAGRDVSDAIDALVDANVQNAAGTIAAALDPARPLPTKMAAARALGTLGDQNVLPQLKKALQDPDPPVRVLAAAALARLGDNAGAEIVRSFENSPVGDLRLLAVEASASGNPTGPWVTVATGILQDPDPLVRLRAAELLLQHAADPGAARDTFLQALADTNPAMREAATQRLDRLPASALERDLPTLRKLLRDPSPRIQLEAAGSILKISGAIQ
jgi:HEAT repeat protein